MVLDAVATDAELLRDSVELEPIAGHDRGAVSTGVLHDFADLDASVAVDVVVAGPMVPHDTATEVDAIAAHTPGAADTAALPVSVELEAGCLWGARRRRNGPRGAPRPPANRMPSRCCTP